MRVNVEGVETCLLDCCEVLGCSIVRVEGYIVLLSLEVGGDLSGINAMSLIDASCRGAISAEIQAGDG